MRIPLLFLLLAMALPAAADSPAVTNAAVLLGNTYKTNGLIAFAFSRWDAAVSNLQACVTLLPNDTTAYDGLAAAFFVKGDVDAAITNYSREIQIDPSRGMAWLNRGNAWRAKHQYALAITDFNQCIRLGLTNSLVYKCRAAAWAGQKDYDHSLADLTRCLWLRPGDASLVLLRAATFLQAGRPRDAAADYQQVLRQDPDNVEAANDFAWLAATSPVAQVRNGPAAVAVATKACELTAWKKWELLDTLAAAYAEAADFSQATNYERQAMAMVLSGDSSKKIMMQHLLTYEMHQPWRE